MRVVVIALSLLHAGVVLMPHSIVQAQGTEPSPIGFSQGGEPIMLYRLGTGPQLVLILGAQHGGPEINTNRLVRGLLDHFQGNPLDIPPSVTLAIIPAVNPDGLTAGTRRFVSGVDPNRNWGGPDWQPDGYDSNGRFEYGLGGIQPFSEQETRALAEWIITNQPTFVINYHSAGGFMFGGREGRSGELAAAYEVASGYYRSLPGSGERLLSYRASGTTSSWLSQQGIGGIFIELTNAADPEITRNLAGLRALLRVLAD